MAVLGALSVCLEVLRLEDGVKFYPNAGLKLTEGGAQAQSVVRLRRRDDELGPAGLARNGLARELA